MKPLVLIILDGWGIAPPGPGNAISQMTTHNIDSYWNLYPHTELLAAGAAVGLPENEAGNSETGHLNIGAGRVVFQDITRINRSIEDGSFYENPVFLEAINTSRQRKSNIHIMGLLSDAGVHASRNHLQALIQLMEKQDVENVYLHVFTDGRDSLPTSSIPTYASLINKYPIATIMGRYYGMDRDMRLDRTQKAYTALTKNAEYTATSFEEAITNAYKRSETDEFIKPTIIADTSRIQPNDVVIFYNFRIDRTRQLTKMFMDNNPNLYFVTMTEYETGTNCHVAFQPTKLTKTLSEVISVQGLKQLHAAESEKEKFVTYYFNGWLQAPFQNEERVIIPSPKVATYDLVPQMSAVALTDAIVEAVCSKTYDFCVMNYANPDMVGHSGIVEAAKLGCETVDIQAKRVIDSVLAQDGTVIITADHGHAEEMLSPNKEVQTEHSSNPVPLIVCNNAYEHKQVTMKPGVLGDIAPTILYLMHLPKPPEMTGNNLLDGVV
jgi:2,3-bisphosphoglycerate-independent phosphoglycerate mutase